MFRLIFFLSYLPLLIYVYLRCRLLFKTSLGRKIFVAIFSFFALAFPLFDYLAHQTSNSKLDFLIQVGFYTQPYLLYLLFSVLITDLGHLIFRFHRRQWPVILFIFLAPFIAVSWGAWNFNNLKINSYSISIPARQSQLKKMRIVFAADFHLRGHSELNRLQEFVEKTNALNPDLVLLPGDILEGDRHDEEMPELEKAFSKLQSRFGTFAVLGNHESYGPELTQEFYFRAKIQLIRDNTITIPGIITLVGRDDLRFKTRKDFQNLMSNVHKDLPIILLDHRPIDFKRVGADGVDIQVSGHTHNGQVFPFNFITQAMYDLSWGYKQIGKTNFFVTSGLRGWGPQVRTTGDAEMILIEVELK